MKKEILMTLILTIILVNFSCALTFEKEAVNDVIIKEFNQPALFSVTLRGVEAGNYELYTLADVIVAPRGYFSVSGGTNTMDISVYQTDQLKETGYYTFTYSLKKFEGSSYDDKMTIKVVPLHEAIEIGSDTIDPDTDKITFYVQNKERANLKDVKAKFSSIFFDVEKTIDLKPFEKLEISVPISKEEMKKIKAGAYIVKGEFQTDKGKKTVEGKLYLGEKKGIRSEETNSGFIIYTDIITKMNTGNVPQEVMVNVRKNIISRLFTSFSNEPDLVDRTGFGVSYSWVKNLEPTEVFTVKVKTNYIFPFFIILFAAAIIFTFNRYMQTKVEVRKSVVPVRAKGGELALRVTVKVKARKNVENVSVIDRIPSLVKIYESFGFIKPTKVDSTSRRIHWEIGSLQSGEERVVTYIVYSKVGVVGRFSLPPALSVFEREGKIHEVESNNVFYMAEQVKKA
jgi:hypothetical protein